MSITGLVIDERSRDIGNFLVGRLLPFREKRMVGPFIFLDHIGPAELGPGRYLDVDQHPHIGLSTLTYLLEGDIVHRDSLGIVQRISPGSVNLMTAGRGVTHTERTPEDLREETYALEGYQIWLALPREQEEMEPQFHHSPQSDLPSWKEAGASFTLIVGQGFGRTSPVPVFSHLFMVEVASKEAFALDVSGRLEGEIGILISEGSVTACDTTIEKGQMLVSKSLDTCHIGVNKETRVFLFGGTPFPEKRFIDWNFVSHSKDRLKKAKDDWMNGQFSSVPGDHTFVPYPTRKGKLMG
jgi:redox-sensitive bicupin YhaK (pirin superfamily)